MTWRTMRLLLLMGDLEVATGTDPGEVVDVLAQLLEDRLLPIARA